MKAVIMAGGEGTRLRPLTSNRPKPMVPVANKPMLEYVIDLLKKHGFKDIYITVHYLKDAVTSYFEDGSQFGVNIQYSVEDKPLGTAGGVKQVVEYMDDVFVVTSGDVLTDFNLSEIYNFHKSKGAAVTIALAKVENPLEYGVVVTDEEGRVRYFLEKPSWSELVSDTINAGIYVIDKDVFRYVEHGKEFDFSKNLFPLLLQKGEPVYGYLAKGYWCDIGNIAQYIQAHKDVVDGKVKVSLPGKQILPKIWVEEGAVIDEGASIRGPAIIGKDARIRTGAEVLEYTFIGRGAAVDEKASIKHSIIMNRSFVGRSAELRGCIVGERVSVNQYARIFENAVIGDDTVIGAGATVKPGVKIWPAKLIEAGSTVFTNVMWGLKWMRVLFSLDGITGMVNVEISPEFSSRLGAAFGSSLGKNSNIYVARDTFRSSRMVKRALVSGLLSSGVNVYNLRVMATPLLRFSIRAFGGDGGVAITSPHLEPGAVNIRFFDNQGLNIDKASEKKIENIFFRDDFRRVYYDETGSILYPARVIEYYRDSFLKALDVPAIRAARPRIVVDCANGAASQVAPMLYSALGAEAICLNIGGDEHAGPRSIDDVKKSIENLANIVRALDADFGVSFTYDAEKAFFVDDKGNAVLGDQALAVFIQLVLEHHKRGSIVVPVSASRLVEEVVEKYGGKSVRVGITPRSLSEGVIKEKAIFGGSEGGLFICPPLHPVPDGLFATAKLIEYLAKSGTPLSELVSSLPRFYAVRGSVACPWELRGKVFRGLIEELRDHKVDLLDGIKVFHNEGWVLILPSLTEPVLNIYVEGVNEAATESLLKQYVAKIREMTRYTS
ncbi:MAG: hypothetical protein DRJ31_01210 [Candidatus Methanomethylicota archaeon]|mgnify:FL=1|uniref:Nucleotidyl transferase n=1 Tax=Thermoproteota archaeon TaxID=2056631 RepID=A0A497ESY4_9CREN|nr:MAG: hypothetical protein DRJ31_01210 [Candidatus Verstraetearchaeota archaeon]